MITFSIVSFFVKDHVLIAERHLWILVIYIPVFFMTMYVLEMYHLSTFNYQDRIIRNVLFSCLISTLFCLALAPFIQDSPDKYHFLGYYVLFSTVTLTFDRCFSLIILKKLRNKGVCKTIIIGNHKMIENYLYFISKTSFRYDIIGHILVSDESEKCDSSKYLGTIDDIEDILNKNVVDEVIFALPRNYMGEVEKHLLLCEERGLTVKLVLDLFDVQVAKTCLLSVGTLPVLTYHTVSLNNTQLLLKRILDIFGSLIGLVLMGILSIFIVPAIKLDSKGPIFFKQTRVGQNGRHFSLYKFRSMCDDAELKKKELIKSNKIKDGYMFKIENDPRVTRVGAILRKTSLDELPQLLNILKGEMSLVGPRPEMPFIVATYKPWQAARLRVKPGLTGLWQVAGRKTLPLHDNLEYDFFYVCNPSLALDLEILLRTLPAVLRGKGAF
jgi:exopolysaccharide biosynthesis polyprenyl glycosylphosphotransferase